MTFKVPKPDVFDGSKTSLSAVTGWAFSIQEYIELAEIPIKSQVRIAALLLNGTPKQWYINTYQDVTPAPTLKQFIDAFKEHHLTAHSTADVLVRAETVLQGTRRGVSEFSTEFKMFVIQLGHKTDQPNVWVTRHYLRALDDRISDRLITTLDPKGTLDNLITKAANIARNIELGKSTTNSQSRQTTPSSFRPPGAASRGTTSSASTKSDNARTFKKITQAERDYLSKNNGCFFCRQINAGHMSPDCPELKEAEKKRRELERAIRPSKKKVNMNGEMWARPLTPPLSYDTDSTLSSPSLSDLEFASLVESTPRHTPQTTPMKNRIIEYLPTPVATPQKASQTQEQDSPLKKRSLIWMDESNKKPRTSEGSGNSHRRDNMSIKFLTEDFD